MPKIDVPAVPARTGANYPPPYDAICKARQRQALGDAGGLTQFGVNLMRLPPGAWTSQRHWHTHEDEFVWVVEGEGVLVDDAGEHPLRPGDCAAFKAGDPNGHHIQNRSDAMLVLLEVGSRDPERDDCIYPDIDMIARAGEDFARHADGTPYGERA